MQERIPSASRRRFRGRASLRAERGSALVEIMVSAVLVVMVATAVFKSIDAASAISGSNKAKNVATSIAQEKLDEMRSKDPDKLSNYRGLTETKTVDNVTYKISARADWITDSAGGKSCTTGAPGDYLKLYVSVSWPGMTATDKPVEAQTISTQPNGTYNNDGNLAVQITDAANTGVEGIDVSITGASSLTDTTDENGCAFLGHLKPGNYTGSFSRAGYVDMQGVNPQGGTWTVVADQTAFKPYRYDQAASANVQFRTKIPTGPTTSTTYNTTGEYVTFFHVNRNIPLTVGNGTAQTQLTGGALFPFTTAYNVYSGKWHNDCAGTNANGIPTSVLLPTSTNPVVVYEPPVNIAVQISGVAATTAQMANTYIRVRHTTAGCFDTGRFKSTDQAATPIPLPDATSVPVTNGFPAGNYKVCVETRVGSSTRSLTKDIDTGVAQTGNALNTFNVTGSTPSVSGGC